MQKNKCKLKTIFKRGLSFSIALALGAAATSLGLGKVAEAAKPDPTGARTVYLVGENVNFTTGWQTAPTYYNDAAAAAAAQWVGVGTAKKIEAAGQQTISVGDAANGGTTENYTFTAYDWATIYTGTEVTAAHGAAHNAARDAIADSLRFNVPNAENQNMAAIVAVLKTGVLQLVSDGSQINTVNYTQHNGQEVQIVVNGVICKLGKLNVTRTASSIELVNGPTEFCYVATDKKVNMDGLKIKVNYAVGDPEEVTYSEETKGNFSFQNAANNSNFDVDTQLQTTTNVKVIYSGHPATAPFTLYYCTPLANTTSGNVTVNGIFENGATLVAVRLQENDDKYVTMAKEFGADRTILGCYDVIVTNSLGNDAMSLDLLELKFNVGKLYAGQVVTVKHLTHSDTVETYTATVDSDGVATINAKELSPFMIALGATEADKAEAAKTEETSKETATTDAKKANTAKSGTSSVKTGDASIIAFTVFGLIALISAAVLLFMKKSRKEF